MAATAEWAPALVLGALPLACAAAAVPARQVRLALSPCRQTCPPGGWGCVPGSPHLTAVRGVQAALRVVRRRLLGSTLVALAAAAAAVFCFPGTATLAAAVPTLGVRSVVTSFPAILRGCGRRLTVRPGARRFWAWLRPTHTRALAPLYFSAAAHQPATWSSLFLDLHLLLLLAPLGLRVAVTARTPGSLFLVAASGLALAAAAAVTQGAQLLLPVAALLAALALDALLPAATAVASAAPGPAGRRNSPRPAAVAATVALLVATCVHVCPARHSVRPPVAWH